MIALLALSTAARAATWTVGTDAADFTATLALAASGDTLVVPTGTWAACGDTAGRSLTVTGTGTLDGTGCDHALRVASGETVAIDGVTFTNTTGRGLVVEWSTATLSEVTFRGAGRSDWSGGGVWLYGAALTTSGCTFEGNTAWEGGGIYLYAYSAWTDTGSTFGSNTAGSGGGAVLAYYDNTLALTGTTFADNTAGYYGGAVATWNYTDLALADTSFSANTSPSGGGALFYYPTDAAYGTLTVTRSRFVENTAPDGGALWVGWAASAALTDTTFERNVATATGGALLAYVTGTTTLAGNTFCANTAPTGGAASVQWTTTDAWTNNVFAANTATYGGAAHRYASYDGSIVQNSFVGNTATGWGGAYYASWGYADVRNNLVAHNGGAGVYAAETATLAGSTLAYNGFAQNAVADAAGYFYASDGLDGAVVTDDAGLYAWTEADPCADVRLAGDSPMKDAGDPTLLDVDGSRSDIGAWGGPGAPVVDSDGDGFATDADCDDTSDARHPGASERCDGADDDCDGAVDEDATDATTFYADARHPGASERCDGADDDCDGTVDEDAVDAATFYADADGDGFGDPGAPVVACALPDGASENNRDCDDTNRWVHPDASDYPDDGIDADCDGADNTQVFPAEPLPLESSGCAYVPVAHGSAGGVAGGPRPPAPGGIALMTALLCALGARRATRR